MNDPNLEQLLLFFVEGIDFFNQNVVEFSCRDFDSKFVQLTEQEELGDLTVMVLLQDEGAKIRTEMVIILEFLR